MSLLPFKFDRGQVIDVFFLNGHWWPTDLMISQPTQVWRLVLSWSPNEWENLHHCWWKSSITLCALTSVFGGEHDDKGLSVEGVRPAGLTAVIVGVVISHGHHLLPEEERYYLTTSALLWCCVLFPSNSVGFCSFGHVSPVGERSVHQLSLIVRYSKHYSSIFKKSFVTYLTYWTISVLSPPMATRGQID